MKKIIILIILLTGFFTINSIELFAEDDNYQLIPTDLSGTVWTLKTFDYNESDTIEFLEVAPLLWNAFRDEIDHTFGINFISNNENMLYIKFIISDMGDAISITINYYSSDTVTVLDEWYMFYDMSGFDYSSADSDYFSISIIDGEDSKNRMLIALMTTLFTWQNPPTPTEPEIPEEPFLTANQIILLVVSLIMYILAIFMSVLTNNRLLIAFSGLLWVIPIIIIDNFIIRVFSAIVILVSFMILIKSDKEEYYE